MPIARIVAHASYLPAHRLTNEALCETIDSSHEWILARTGICERRIAEKQQSAAELGVRAAELALRRSGCLPEAVDLILVATMTPDRILPTMASEIQARLGCVHAGVVDLSAACSGYLYALITAKAYIEAGLAKVVLIVAAEKLSQMVNWQDRSTAILFGDAAASCVVAAQGRGWSLEAPLLGGDGRMGELFTLPHPPGKIAMNGPELFKHAVRRMEETCRRVLLSAHVELESLAWLVGHQANLRILEATAQRLGLPSDKLYCNIAHYGNTSAASLGIALDELWNSAAHPPSPLLLVAFGAGLTWAGALSRLID